MTVREAKDAARDWVLQNRNNIPGLVGAFVPGSIGYLDDVEPYPPSSDVDLTLLIDGPVPDLFMEPAHPLRPQKILHRGALLDTLAQPLDWFLNVEGILAGDTRAPDLARLTPVLDPTGEIARVQRELAASCAKERWVRARCDAAARAATGYIDLATAPTARLGRYASELLQTVVMLQAALCSSVQTPCVADLGRVTLRKAFVAARELYARHGATDLYRRILSILGSAEMVVREVEPLLEEYSTTFDLAIRVVKTLFFGAYDLQEICRPMVVGGARELVQTGFHREAMYFVAAMRSWMQNAIENDGTGEEREASRKGYERMLSALGIRSIADARSKAEALRSLLPDLGQLAERVLEASPRIDRS